MGYVGGLASVGPKLVDVQHEDIEAQFPDECDQLPKTFSVGYTNTTQYRDTETMQTWGLKACMPANVIESPWKAKRDRDDFSEQLYIDATLDNYPGKEPDRAIYKSPLARQLGTLSYLTT